MPVAEDRNRPQQVRAASDPGGPIRTGRGTYLTGPLCGLIRTAGGADVCGFVRIYVRDTYRPKVLRAPHKICPKRPICARHPHGILSERSIAPANRTYLF